MYKIETVVITDFNGVDHSFKCNTGGVVIEGEYDGLCVCEVEAILNHK